jgi:hypothetical protein
MHDQQFLWAHYILLLVSQFSLETQFQCNNETQTNTSNWFTSLNSKLWLLLLPVSGCKSSLWQNMIQKLCNTPIETPKGNPFVGQRNLVPGNYSLSCYKILSPTAKTPLQNLRLLGWNITAARYKCFIQMHQLPCLTELPNSLLLMHLVLFAASSPPKQNRWQL